MAYPYGTEKYVFIYIGITTIISLIVLAIWFKVIIPFMREREHIKIEMRRSLSENEYYYWKRKLRRVYLRRIPVIGRFFR